MMLCALGSSEVEVGNGMDNAEGDLSGHFFNTLHFGKFCVPFCHLIFFLKNSSKNYFKNTFIVSSSLGSDQALHIVGA